MPLAAAVAVAGVATAGASIVAGNKAANAQKNAAAQQVAESRRQYDQTRADFTPFREAGTRAISTLEQLYGLQPRAAGTPTAADMVKATPGYDFRRSEGLKAVERSAASRGLLKSGTALKAIDRFAEGLASDEYNDFASRLQAIASGGQGATGSTAAAGENATARIAQAYGDAGNARASSYLNTGQAISSGIQNIASAYLWNQGSKAPSKGVWI